MNSRVECTVIGNTQQRLDAFLARMLPDYSRSLIQKWIKAGCVQVNQTRVKAKHTVFFRDQISIDIPEEERISLVPQAIPLDIIYEDPYIIVINKAPGMVVHPSLGHHNGTLVNALLYHCTDLSTINGIVRPGIVHRLDKDTSGVLVVAKNDVAHRNLSDQFAQRTMYKVYCALVAGNVRPGMPRVIDEPIGRHSIHRKKMAIRATSGKKAITEYKIIYQGDDYTFVKVYIKTGRTHQIRVHMSHVGLPVIGDHEYGSKKYNNQYETYAQRQLLHAYAIRLKHPVYGEEMLFIAKLPSDIRAFLSNVR